MEPKRHRRTSTQWNPPTRPVLDRFSSFPKIFYSNDAPADERVIRPNIHEPHVARYCLPNYRNFPHNDISTTKYNPLTFLPMNLYYQLQRFANIYLLMIAGLQFIPQLHIQSKYLGLIPICFVMFLTALKDGYEDFRRHRLDRKINHTRCYVWDSIENRFRKMRWEHIIVGDIVHLSNDETIPADILIIKSSDPEGQVFVETANLDGETNRKQLGVLPRCRRLCAQKFDADEFQATIYCGQPSKEIPKISGSVEYADGSKDEIRKGNVMLRGCQVRNTAYVDGIVLYAGKDTKAMLNNGNAKNKRSTLEALTNRFVVICVVILAVISGLDITLFLASAKHPGAPYLLEEGRVSFFSILLNFISLIINYQVLIPLSLYISIEVIRGSQLWMMGKDSQMYHEEQDRNFVYHSLNIPEELGQIKYVLSDKTGTLTENRMVFRHCAIAGERFPPDVVPPGGESEENPRTNCRLQTMIRDGVPPDSAVKNFFLALATCNTVFVNKPQDADTVDDGYFERDNEFVVGNSVFYMGNDSTPTPTPAATPSEERPSDICLELGAQAPGTIKRTPTWTDRLNNSVKFIGKRLRSFKQYSAGPKLPATAEEQAQSPRSYEAQSPDDLALVYAARAYGFTLKNREAHRAVVAGPSGEVEFDIAKVLPFDSTRKRMSVVLRERATGRLTLFCKGADTAILRRLSPAFLDSPEGRRYVEHSQAALDHYATDGLRTLCVAMKTLEEDAFQEWLDVYEEAERSAVDENDPILGEAASQMEQDMELLGVTGIEDRLQENVEETISSLRRAGIQVWVLTGDKLETALNIARSCGLFGNEASTVQIDTLADLESVDPDGDVPYNLVLDPDAIDSFRQGDARMVECVANCAAVLCYRMTPAGKADVVRTVKKQLRGKTLAIGDGANDVPMIQTAHVGIGITGMEGMQAAMASDFALARFYYLRKLLLVHGHWSYYRIASAFLYFLYKNATWVFVVFWYQFFNGFSADTPIDPLFSTLYATILTSLQPVFHGIYDQDADEFVLSDHPELYKQGRQNKLYRLGAFFLNMVDALWQSAVIFFVAYGVYNETASDFWAFSFQLCSGIYLVNTGHLLLITGCWTMPLVWMNVFFTVFYFGINFLYSLVASPQLKMGSNPPVGIYIASMTDYNFWYVLALTTVVALLPRTIAILMTNTIRPSDVFLEQEKKKAEIQQKTPDTVFCGRPLSCFRF